MFTEFHLVTEIRKRKEGLRIIFFEIPMCFLVIEIPVVNGEQWSLGYFYDTFTVSRLSLSKKKKQKIKLKNSIYVYG